MSKIVFLGDSITRGATLAVADTFAYQVGVANGYAPADIINSGVSGDESPDALARVGADAIALAPDGCVVCLLLNDAKSCGPVRPEGHPAELQSLMRTSYHVSCMTPTTSRPLIHITINITSNKH